MIIDSNGNEHNVNSYASVGAETEAIYVPIGME